MSYRDNDTLDLIVVPSLGEIRLTLSKPSGGTLDFGPARRSRIVSRGEVLTERLTQLSTAVSTSWATRPAEDRARCVGNVSAAGLDLSIELFGAQLELFFSEVKLSAAKRLRLHLLDESFSIPWDYLSAVLDGRQLYLGELLTVTPPFIDRPTLPNSDEQFNVTKLETFDVGLAEDHLLKSAHARRGRGSGPPPPVDKTKEISSFTVITGGGPERVDVLDGLDARTSRRGEVNKLMKWLGAPRRVIHFNCHGESPKIGSTLPPNLRLANAFMVGPKDLDGKSHNSDFNSGLVTLNVCNSAVGKYATTDALNQLFHAQNAAAVVCTSGAVEDGFATRFAHEFYGRLREQTLLDAVNGARRKLLEASDHPMSLMFTFSGPSDFRLAVV